MVSRRNNFQKIYDLTERVLPAGIDTSLPTPEEVGRFMVRRALKALGIAEIKEILKYMQPESARDADMQAVNRETIEKSIDSLVESGEVVPVKVEAVGSTPHYTLHHTLKNFPTTVQNSPAVFILSPFDNLIIQRERAKKYFQFDYSLECYLPEAKRKYGYFVLPVLWGENFAARLDARADQKNNVFAIKNLVFETSNLAFDALLPKLAGQLMKLARFNNCSLVKLEKVKPARLKPLFKRILSTLPASE